MDTEAHIVPPPSVVYGAVSAVVEERARRDVDHARTHACAALLVPLLLAGDRANGPSTRREADPHRVIQISRAGAVVGRPSARGVFELVKALDGRV